MHRMRSNRIKRFLLLLGFVVLAFGLHAQDGYISGRIVDSLSGEPLVFVSIVYNASGQGVVTNMEGYFRIPRSNRIQFLQVRYVGYRSKYISVNPATFRNNRVVLLSPEPLNIGEVIVYPTENPAHRIIKLASENRIRNHPEKTGPFSYMDYDKMVIGVEPDSAYQLSDTDSISFSGISLPDSIHYGMDGKRTIDLKRFLEKQYLFMMETVSSRKFLSPEKNKEEIIASKVSGISQPTFVVLARQFQSFSFYDNFVNIANQQYLNPISTGSTDKYFFLIQDTLYTEQQDTVFIISFRPMRGKNFEGLKGVLYINSHGYAIQNVLAEAYEQKNQFFSISIQQQYELIEGTRWFPVQLNTTVHFNAAQFQPQAKSLKIVGTGKSYLMNINIHPHFDENDFSDVQLEVKPDAHKQSQVIWNKYRIDSLNPKEIETYRVIDSIGKAEHLDRTITSFETLLTGYLPGRYFNFDLRRFIDYNPYEGLRIGAGGRTSSLVSKRFTLGGYLAYSFGDEAFKYGGNLTLHILPEKELGISILYRHDVSESGGIKFYEIWSLAGSAFIRDYMVEVMDVIREAEVMLGFRVLKYLTGQVYLKKSILWPTNDYAYSLGSDNPMVSLTRFYFTESGIRLRYAFNETFMKTPRGNRFSLGTNYPVFYLNISRGTKLFNGEFRYWRTEMKVTKIIKTKRFGDTRLAVTGGLVTGSTPYSKLYVGQGSYRTFTLESEQSFGTMRFNEFLSDRFMALYIKQDFGKLLFRPRGKFQPEIALVHNIGFGKLLHDGHHENINYKTMEKGYFEGGLLINNLIRIQIFKYGLGVLYRYGPYAYSKTIDNFAFKLTLQFNL
jgi:hypothetical protein